jgi:hypothetical protein
VTQKRDMWVSYFAIQQVNGSLADMTPTLFISGPRQDFVDLLSQPAIRLITFDDRIKKQ